MSTGYGRALILKRDPARRRDLKPKKDNNTTIINAERRQYQTVRLDDGHFMAGYGWAYGWHNQQERDPSYLTGWISAMMSPISSPFDLLKGPDGVIFLRHHKE